MTGETQPYPEDPSGLPDGSAAPGSSDGLVALSRFWTVIRRRWRVVLAVWLPMVGVLVPCVYVYRKPTYTATAQIQVLAVLPRVLYKDETSQIPMFESYLRTQAELAASYQVLRAALTDPALKGLPLLSTPDPVSVLRLAMTAEPVRGTQIVQISVTQPVPADAVALTKAIVDAYLARAEDEEKKNQDDTRTFLENEQVRLRGVISSKQRERNELAAEYATISIPTYESLRANVAQSGMQTKEFLEATELEILQLRDQIRQIEEGVYVGVLDSTPSKQQQAIEDDPLVRSVRERLVAESARLTQLRSGMTDEAKEVIAVKEQIRQLQADLEKERVRAAEDVAKAGLEMQKRMKDSLLSEKRAKLVAAERHRDALEQRVEKQEAEAKKIGKTSLDIQSVQDEIDQYKRDLEVVEERIKTLTTESRRQARISRASDPEIRPTGVDDKRFKLSLAGSCGALLVAFAVAFLKDRIEACIYAPSEVESEVGLPTLGVVPPLSELDSGRATIDDFSECYRLVRVNLLSAGVGETPPKSVLVTSAQAGEGKTSTAVNLAASLAELGGRVLLIDGDIQAPRVGEVMACTAPYGLKEVLFGERSLSDCVAPSRIAGLDLLLAGMDGDLIRRVLNNKSAARIVQEATALYDYVVIDSPPALGAADALVWAQAAEGVIVCTFAGQSSVKVTQLARHRLKIVGAKVLGAVICNLQSKVYYSSTMSRRDTEVHVRTDAGSVRKYAMPFMQQAGDRDKRSGSSESPTPAEEEGIVESSAPVETSSRGLSA